MPDQADPVSQTPTVISTSSSRPAAPGSAWEPGALLAGRYRIIALLGRGGMGEVYRADDLLLGQPVALKFLPETLAKNPDATERFRNEVRIARQVSHPNVCRVYDVGEIEGRYFLSMEYVDGEDLGSLLRRIGRLPADKGLEIARKLCAGLAAAHEKNVLHRDLKPGNVMLDGRGHVLLTDFGLAGLAGQIEGAEVRSGTPAYMAPEQLAGQEVTIRSDIYSLGLVLYELFTGKRPFESDTMAGLMQARKESAPVNPSTLVRELEPGVERVILRCLDPNPRQRPASALAVAAALPGGDPLAAALAAGETPSPQMVAAAGEGTGLAPRFAVPLLVAILAALGFVLAMKYQASALDRIRPELSGDVLSQKARDLIQRLGYAGRPVDSASGFQWDWEYFGHVQSTDKPAPRWSEVLAQRPSLMRFWYRQSQDTLFGAYFHSDLLTPGIVTPGDPPPIDSGMIGVRLDHQGRLIEFEAMPPQKLDPLKEPAPKVDWSPLFAAAELDPAQFQADEPQWTWLSASDTRAAWTGKWPGSGRPLRVEAAAFRGKPVDFALIGPWRGADRTPSSGPDRAALFFLILGVVAVLVCAGAALLARKNLAQGRGDRRGAMRLAVFIFCVHMTLWLVQAHFNASVAMLGLFFLALCTSVFYGAVIWTIYVALEPYVRRRWPQALISWTSVLAGRARDPIVGRDVLIGVAMGVGWLLISWMMTLWTKGAAIDPELGASEVLHGARSAVGAWLVQMHNAIRTALFFFFLLALFRALLRKGWLAGAAFVLAFTGLNILGAGLTLSSALGSLVVFSVAAVVSLRWGLLALAVGVFVNNLLKPVPVTTQTSAWYFPATLLILASVVVLAGWAFRSAIAGRRLFRGDLFG